MPDEYSAAQEHALMTELREPLDDLFPGYVTDVSNPQFPLVLRGYDRARVDAYVVSVAGLVAELEGMKVPDAAVRTALEQVGEETSSILQRAHDTAADITSRSRSEAEDRLERARLEAEQIVADAHRLREALDRDTDRVWRERTKMIDDTRNLADELLAVADRALERFPPETEAEPAAPAAEAGAAAEPVAPAAVEPVAPAAAEPIEPFVEPIEPFVEPTEPFAEPTEAWAEPIAPSIEASFPPPAAAGAESEAVTELLPPEADLDPAAAAGLDPLAPARPVPRARVKRTRARPKS